MLKLLIVDDDYLVRMDLRTQLNWLENGYELTEDAINGYDAIEKIKLYEPDIMILDMEMPKMNGIQVLEFINEQKLKIKVLVLSCHEDYANVKEAMKLGASDYLLKHNFKAHELLETLKRIKDLILNEQNQQKDLYKMRLLAKRNQLTNVYKGIKSPSSEFLSNLFDTDIEKNGGGKFINVVFSVDNRMNVSAEIMLEIENIISEYYDDVSTSILVVTDKNEYTLLKLFDNFFSSPVIYSMIIKEVQELTTKIRCVGEVTLSFGISDIFKTADELLKKQTEARWILSHKYYMGAEQIFCRADIANFVEKSNLTEETIKKFIEQLVFESISINDSVNNFFEELKRINVLIDEIKIIKNYIILTCYQLIKAYNLENKELEQIITRFKWSDAIEEDINCLNEFISLVKSCINETKGSATLKMIDGITKYINLHYHESLSLKAIAEKNFVSVGHLTSLFKKVTGTTFIDYLNQLRIKKAKELLLIQDARVIEVSEKVGFNNYRYFTKIFKLHVKMTPKEYIECMQSNELLSVKLEEEGDKGVLSKS